MNRETLERVCRAFAARFGGEPTAAAWAPGRVNLIGEHTDYNAGFVLPMAIGRGIAAVARRRDGPGQSRVLAADLGETGYVECCSVEPGTVAPGTWLSYAVGVMSLIGKRADQLPARSVGSPQHGWDRRSACPKGAGGDSQAPAIDLAIAGDLPVGAGLASSAALEVAVSLAVGEVLGVAMSPGERASLCRRAEHEYAGVPCGIMDQAIVCSATPGHALLIDCRDGSSTPVRIPDAGRVVVMNTGVRHELAAGEYARRRDACLSAASALGVGSLRDASGERLAQSVGPLTPEQVRCARHVVGENERTVRAALALADGDLATVGILMNQSHDSLRDDFRVSCPELDSLVEIARGVPGVFGARMTGAGFGGCAIALATPEAVGPLGVEIGREYPRRHGRHAEVFVTEACGAARLAEA